MVLQLRVVNTRGTNAQPTFQDLRALFTHTHCHPYMHTLPHRGITPGTPIFVVTSVNKIIDLWNRMDTDCYTQQTKTCNCVSLSITHAMRGIA